jgi:hypothetical protein
MPVILATQEVEIKRIMVRSQPREIDPQDPISKNFTKIGLVEWLKVKAMSSSPSTTHTTHTHTQIERWEKSGQSLQDGTVWIDKVLSYNMGHSALTLTLRYFHYMYEVCFYLRGN